VQPVGGSCVIQHVGIIRRLCQTRFRKGDGSVDRFTEFRRDGVRWCRQIERGSREAPHVVVDRDGPAVKQRLQPEDAGQRPVCARFVRPLTYGIARCCQCGFVVQVIGGAVGGVDPGSQRFAGPRGGGGQHQKDDGCRADERTARE
jgi:hypothetical protein